MQIEHSEFCTTHQERVEVVRGETSELLPMELLRGCEVSGIASLKGKPVGQIKVTINSIGKVGSPSRFKCEAVSDNEGRFLFPKPLPPGRYELMGANQLSANVFERMVQLKQSRKEVVVGKRDQQLRFDVAVGQL